MVVNNFLARHYIHKCVDGWAVFSAEESQIGCYSTRRAALKRVLKYFEEADEHQLTHNLGL